MHIKSPKMQTNIEWQKANQWLSGVERDDLQKATKEFWGVMFAMFIVEMFPRVYTYVKTDQIVPFTYVQVSVLLLYFYQAEKKNTTEIPSLKLFPQMHLLFALINMVGPRLTGSEVLCCCIWVLLRREDLAVTGFSHWKLQSVRTVILEHFLHPSQWGPIECRCAARGDLKQQFSNLFFISGPFLTLGIYRGLFIVLEIKTEGRGSRWWHMLRIRGAQGEVHVEKKRLM